MIVVASFLLLFGLFIGSFLNVIIDRVPREESFLFGRSHCDLCQHTLAWYDLFPLFSFLFLRGKCRFCHKKIGWQYPIVEAATGLLFAGNYIIFAHAPMITLLFSFCILMTSIVIFFTDLWFGIIPDIAIGCAFCISVLVFIVQKEQWVPHLIGCALYGLFFLSLWFLTKKKGIGFGDVKLAAFLGFLLGIPFIIPACYIAFLTGAFVALILIVLRKKRLHGDTLPFGPFLILGGLATFYWGNILWFFFTKIILHM